MMTASARRARELSALLTYQPEIGDSDDAAELRLWLAVAHQALEDLWSASRHYRGTAIAYFSDQHGAWALLCDRLGWDAEALASRVLAGSPPPETDTHTTLGRARAWVRSQVGEWHRGTMGAALQISRVEADWVMTKLRRSGLVEQTGRRGVWRTVGE